MNHTLYFNDEDLYKTFCRYGKNTHGSVSKAINEAMRAWLEQHQGWSSTLRNIPTQTDDFRFEDSRQSMHFQDKDVF